MLADGIRPLRHSEASRTVSHWCQRADAVLDAGDTAAEQQRDAATVSVATSLDGTVAINGHELGDTG